MAVLRALVLGAVLTGCLAGPVHAQQQPQDVPNPLKEEEEQRRKDDAAIDKQYKSTLQRTHRDATQTQPTDPWQNMRGTDDSKAKR